MNKKIISLFFKGLLKIIIRATTKNIIPNNHIIRMEKVPLLELSIDEKKANILLLLLKKMVL